MAEHGRTRTRRENKGDQEARAKNGESPRVSREPREYAAEERRAGGRAKQWALRGGGGERSAKGQGWPDR